MPPHAGYEWRSFPDDTDQIALWRDGRQLGNYRFSTGEYFPRRDEGWGETTAPPYPPPLYPVQVEADGTLNFGLDRSHPPAQGKHLLNGKEVGKEELLQALGEPRLRDDSHWLSLTVIGAEAERKSVLSDLQTSPLLAPWKDRLKVQDYAPQHWAVRDTGFVTTGHPTIYCQAADGTVLHRQDEYRGPEALAEVLRQADPSYRPQRDPDLNRPLSSVPPWIWLAGGLFLFLLLKGDEK
jgi:hypothetical protein